MMGKFFRNSIARLVLVGADPMDDENLRLRKSLLVLCSIPFVFAGFAWGLLYFYFDEPLAGAIPFTYAVASLLSIFNFARTRNFRFFRFSQLFLTLILPFLLMMALGGYIKGSAVIMWSLICPIGAMLFDDPKNSPRWFLAFLCLVISSGFLHPYLNFTNNLSEQTLILFFVINIIGVSFIIFSMVYYFVGQKKVFQERSEALLMNILPREIAAILKQDQKTIADQFDGTSVLFADLVGFTAMSEKMSPKELVTILDTVFSQFDNLVEKYDLEKIKTIGDCYMVASGVPRPRSDHAQALTCLALEMREYLECNPVKGHNLLFRFGLNSGSVVAGVIGRKKFIYDLWGDVVNTASRMESHGQAGYIQITRATYELIKDDFICDARGTVLVKGKGEMETWFVTDMKSAAA